MVKKSISNIILALMGVGFIALCVASSHSEPADARWVSWQTFCESRGYDPLEQDDPAHINEYLDAWRGSVAEEQALIAAGCEIF